MRKFIFLSCIVTLCLFELTNYSIFSRTLYAQVPPVAQQQDQVTRLLTAAQDGNLDQMRAAIASGANVDIRGKYGMTPLMLSTFFGKTDCVQALIVAHADLNARNNGGDTALSLASSADKPAIARALVASGAKVDVQNLSGDSPLILASRKGSADVVDILVTAGADVNLQEDTEGSTALMEAAKAGNARMVKALLDAHANVSTKDNDGKTAADYASNYPSVTTLINKQAPENSLVTKSQIIDGNALVLQFSKQGIEGRAHINISKNEISQTFVSGDSVKLSYSIRHEWSGPVTLRGFDAGGVPSYSIGVLVSKQYQNYQIAEGVVPLGAGTVYRSFGNVQFIGNTIQAEGSRPLLFVVYNSSQSSDAKPDFITSGRLGIVTSKLVDDKLTEDNAHVNDAFISMIHVGGTGWAKLRDGTRITFK